MKGRWLYADMWMSGKRTTHYESRIFMSSVSKCGEVFIRSIDDTSKKYAENELLVRKAMDPQ